MLRVWHVIVLGSMDISVWFEQCAGGLDGKKGSTFPLAPAGGSTAGKSEIRNSLS